MNPFFDLLVAVALVSLAYGLVSRRAERSVLTAPMVAVLAVRHRLQLHPSGAKTFHTRAWLASGWRRVLVLLRPGCPHGRHQDELLIALRGLTARARERAVITLHLRRRRRSTPWRPPGSFFK